MATNIYWTVTDAIYGDPSYDQIQIYRSQSETQTYSLIDTIQSGVNNVPPAQVTMYVDNTAGNDRTQYYGVRFFNSIASIQTQFIVAFPELSPRESRWVFTLRQMMGSILQLNPQTEVDFTDEELYIGVKMALQAFNIYPPVTSFISATFPSDWEPILFYLAQLFTLLNKYLGISINDFSYNDNGLSLNIDRGSRVNIAIQNSQKLINDLLAITKLEFAFEGESVGTLQLPVGIGGVISRGISNVLDIFNSFGR